MKNSIHPLAAPGSVIRWAIAPIANRLIPIPEVPTSIRGFRPHLSTVAIAINVKSTPAPLMMICCNNPASTPVDALRFLKIVAPK